MLGKKEAFSNWCWAEVLLYNFLQEAMGQRRGDLELRFNFFFVIWKSYLLFVKILPRCFHNPPTALNVNVYSQDDFPASEGGLRIKWSSKVFFVCLLYSRCSINIRYRYYYFWCCEEFNRMRLGDGEKYIQKHKFVRIMITNTDKRDPLLSLTTIFPGQHLEHSVEMKPLKLCWVN